MASADRLIEVFNEAKVRPPGAERDQYLAEACRNEPALKEQVLLLLKAHVGAGDFLLQRSQPPLAPPLTEKPGDKIGRYKLLEQIGEGGCGVVYMAEQEEPVRRRVALKVIKLGMDTKQVIARFEAERQALAMMDHPNIAKVLDGGATETGRPFFVMELVRGIKITDYCDQNNLSTNERLELFIQVCQAIQHAHQKGVIHRDIKPSNILVTLHDDVAVPKVIDFGIAKATTGQLTDKTVFTAFAQFIGTPAYMSPEQAQMSGLDVDTRADIYSLGVLLYELLTGNTPFDAKELLAAGMDEMRRKIREEEPTRPSICLSTMQVMDLTTVARRRHVEPPKLIHLIRGDLDWLVMKCLEKDRTRRYETANALAMDLQRHLNDEPVVACPPSQSYRFQKFVRRNKLAFAAASAITAALVLGLGLSTWMFFKEKQARQRAVAAEQDQARLRRQAEAEVTEGRRVAKFLGTLAESLRTERNLTNSESAYRESLAMWKRLPGDERPAVANLLQQLSELLSVQGKAMELESLLQEQPGADTSATESAQLLFGHMLWQVGNAYLQRDQFKDAERAFEQALQKFKQLQVQFPTNAYYRQEQAFSLRSLSDVMQRANRLTEAEASLRTALVIYQQLVNEVPASTFYLQEVAFTWGRIAEVLVAQGKPNEAEAMCRDELARQKKLFGDVHRGIDVALGSLARVLRQEGKLAEAETVWREELAMERKLSGDEHPFVATSLSWLGATLSEQAKHAEAEAMDREALKIRRRLPAEEQSGVAYSLTALGYALRQQDKHAEAEEVYREVLALRRKLPADDPRLVAALSGLTTTLLAAKKFAEAEPPARECLIIREKKLPDDWRMFNARSLLGGSLLGQKKYTEAEPLLLSAYEGMKQREDKIPAVGKSRVKEALQRLVQLYEATSQSEKAAEWNRKLAEFDQAAAEKKTAAPKP